MDLSCDIFSVIFLDHPGFHYSADGDKKDSPQTKEGPTPRRGRRKGMKVNKLSKIICKASLRTFRINQQLICLTSQNLYLNY